MRTVEQLSRAFKSKDDDHVLAAVKECITLLREGDRGALDLPAIGDRLYDLTGHADSKVREAVADAAQYLPDAAYERVIQPLLKDGSHYVRDQANRTLGRRSARRRTAAVVEENDEQNKKDLAAIERLGGAPARELAERVAARRTEQYMANLQHEASRPLTTVYQSAELLQIEVRREQPDLGKILRFVDLLNGPAHALVALLESARSFTKNHKPNIATENVRALLEEAARRIRERPGAAGSASPQVGAPGAEPFKVQIECDRTLDADVDKAQLLRALENVILNAVEAYDRAPPETVRRVRIAAAKVRGDTHVEIRIADEGCGMSEDAVRQAYVPFGSSKQRGSGFGVPIARKIAATHGGTLDIESAAGTGTTVTLTVPVRHAEVKR